MKRLIAALLIAPLAWPQIPLGYSGVVTGTTWSVTQVKWFDTSGHGTGGSACTQPTTVCTVNVTAIGSSNTLVAFAVAFGAQTTLVSISGQTSTDCTACDVTNSGANASIGVRYVLSATPGQTTVTCTVGASASFLGCGVYELHCVGGCSNTYDVGGGNGSVTCSSCSGPSLTTTVGANDVVINILNPFISAPNAGVSGTGWVTGLDDNCCSAIAAASHVNASNGSPVTWTMPSAQEVMVSGIALKDTGGGGGLTLLSHGSATTSMPASSVAVTFAITGTPDLIVAVASYSVSLTQTMSDSSGNTYTLPVANTAGDTALNIYYKCNPTTTGTMTFTNTSGASGGDLMSLAVATFSGSACPSSFTTATSNLCCTSSGGTFQPGSVTAKLLVSAVAATSSTADMVGSGFTVIENKQFTGGGTNTSISLAYLIQGSATPQNPTWTVGTQSDIAGGGVGMAGFN